MASKPSLTSCPHSSGDSDKQHQLPKSVLKTFQDGMAKDVLGAALPLAAFSCALTSFYTLAMLWIAGSDLAAVVSTLAAFVVYRGCVDGLYQEAKSLVEG